LQFSTPQQFSDTLEQPGPLGVSHRQRRDECNGLSEFVGPFDSFSAPSSAPVGIVRRK